MKAVVLTGGFATRLRPLTLTRPKPLLPILGKPLLDWILESLAKSGVDEVILSVRYLAEMIKNRYGTGERFGIRIRYAEERRPLGDAGPIPLIEEMYGLDGTFIVAYGDIFSNIDVNVLLNYHKDKVMEGALATMALTPVDDPSRYGVAVLDEDGKVVEFQEKPPREKAKSNVVNAGFYIFEAEALRYFPREKYPSKIARDVLPRMVEDGVLYGFIHTGLWSDIGVPADYARANFMALKTYFPEGYIHESAEISDEAEIIPPVYIGPGTKIEGGSSIGPNAVIEDNVEIGPYTRIKDSVILSGVTIEGASVIEGAVIGASCFLGRWARVMKGAVLGDEVVVNPEVVIAERVVVLPYKEIVYSVKKPGEVIL